MLLPSIGVPGTQKLRRGVTLRTYASVSNFPLGVRDASNAAWSWGRMDFDSLDSFSGSVFSSVRQTLVQMLKSDCLRSFRLATDSTSWGSRVLLLRMTSLRRRTYSRFFFPTVIHSPSFLPKNPTASSKYVTDIRRFSSILPQSGCLSGIFNILLLAASLKISNVSCQIERSPNT